MTKAEILDALGRLIRNRSRAFNVLMFSDKHPQQEALNHLKHWMPKPTWSLQRIVRFVCNNRDKIDKIMPHRDKYRKYQDKLKYFLTECELLNYEL